MAAEVDLGGGREPAQMVTRALLDEEGGLAEIVLHGDGLEGRVGQPGFQRTDGGRIAGKDGAGEGIDLIDWDFHIHSVGMRAGGRQGRSEEIGWGWRSGAGKARACPLSHAAQKQRLRNGAGPGPARTGTGDTGLGNCTLFRRSAPERRLEV